MEDSFRVRVDKIFGTLGGGGGGGVGGDNAPSSADVSSSLWSLTDEEIERREWNRHKEDEEDDEVDRIESAALSNTGESLESDLHDLSEEGEEDEEEEEQDGERKRRRGGDDEDWDVQSNIGRDCTLDFEEEEDAFDKIAVGAKQTGDSLFMKDVKFADYGIDEPNSYGELPNSFQAVPRDPRANHTAAIIRLKEDAEASGDLDSLQLSDHKMVSTMETEDSKIGELNGDNPKSILKKRENLVDSRSQKRVRFSCDPISSSQIEEQQVSGTSDLASESSPHDGAVQQNVSDLSQYSPGVPDYVRNPSKYTRYTFDSSDDMDDQSNKKAFLDFFQQLRKNNASNSSLDDTPADISKPVIFTPKTKPEDASIVKRSEGEHNAEDNSKNKTWPIGLTAEDEQGSEVSAMEEDEPCLQSKSSQKPGRQYRARNATEADDNLA